MKRYMEYFAIVIKNINQSMHTIWWIMPCIMSEFCKKSILRDLSILQKDNVDMNRQTEP